MLGRFTIASEAEASTAIHESRAHGQNDKKLPIQDGRGLLEGILCCTSGFKANLMHLSSGGAWHIGYTKVCQSLVLVLPCSVCSRYCLVVSRLHHRRIDWVSIFSLHSLQFVPFWPWNWWSKRWKDGQYKTAGDSLNIPKLMIVQGIGCGLNLNNSFHCSSVFGRGRGLLSMGRQSIRKTCHCLATSCHKKPELLGWYPPRPSWISITDFNVRCHLT